jgi:hypothetical protein
MKPISQISSPQRSRRGGDLPAKSRVSHPAVDCHYQPIGNFRASSQAKAPASSASLRHLSSGFFATESKREYLMEALCFVIMTGVSAWPIVLAARALSLLK